jgi:hypothetical protein
MVSASTLVLLSVVSVLSGYFLRGLDTTQIFTMWPLLSLSAVGTVALTVARAQKKTSPTVARGASNMSGPPASQDIQSPATQVKADAKKSARVKGGDGLVYPIRITNELTGQVITPNSIIKVDNDFFEGRMYVRMRSDPLASSVQTFFEDNKRMQLEICCQGKFKRAPKGVVYLGAEWDDQIEMGFWKKKLVGLIARVVRSMNRDVVMTTGNEEHINLLPLLVFPTFQAADVSIESPPGAPLPKLEEIYKSVPNIDRVTVAPLYPFKEDCSYSISFFSDQVKRIFLVG